DEEEVREARYCNTRACPNRRCCRPFVYTRGGKCVRPYNEDEVAVDPNTETRTLPPMPEGDVKCNLTGRFRKKLFVVSTHSRLNKEVTDNGSAEEAEEFEDEDLAGLRSGEGERDDPFYYYYYYYYYDEKE
ncbi:unnamed protein product, partial [Toxocara canis]|uniref:Secreted protein n=1 Tax=Toxocara canis TaxID=6265 RepID=A0A183V8P0_TOXCA